ncbi:hypothetical protein PAJ34TS1_09570 [Paenibacillus azoreducens]|uniref:Uncharacterized protein n=1 Tax=Paenibacillus azoreducens TaxID=116718 RepID=A0A919YG06_9BACL|nr:hypothetical protein J34TS1_47460 [Paenibacillus azoreducens]
MRDLKILKEREACMLFQTCENDSGNGWIGGNAQHILMTKVYCLEKSDLIITSIFVL